MVLHRMLLPCGCDKDGALLLAGSAELVCLPHSSTNTLLLFGALQKCCLCSHTGSAMKPTTAPGIWCHVACAVWCPQANFGDKYYLTPVTGMFACLLVVAACAWCDVVCGGTGAASMTAAELSGMCKLCNKPGFVVKVTGLAMLVV